MTPAPFILDPKERSVQRGRRERALAESDRMTMVD
jgi:hypothetical protein